MTRRPSTPERWMVLERKAWMMRFGLSYKRPDHWLPDEMLLQLSRCRDDEARRLILGKSE